MVYSLWFIFLVLLQLLYCRHNWIPLLDLVYTGLDLPESPLPYVCRKHNTSQFQFIQCHILMVAKYSSHAKYQVTNLRNSKQKNCRNIKKCRAIIRLKSQTLKANKINRYVDDNSC